MEKETPDELKKRLRGIIPEIANSTIEQIYQLARIADALDTIVTIGILNYRPKDRDAEHN